MVASFLIRAGATNRSVQMIVAFGESNSGGYAPNASASGGELASRSEVQMWNVDTDTFENLDIGTNNNLDHAGLNSTTHGIELELANAVAAGRFSASTVYYVQTGAGGSQIAEWAVGHPSGYWTEFLARTQAARAWLTSRGMTPVITVFYTQGINDAVDFSSYVGGANPGQDGSTWRTSTETVLANIRTELGANTRIIMTKFNTAIVDIAGYNTSIDTIIAGLSNSAAIMTPEVGGNGGTEWQGDGNHWTYLGFKTLCNLFIDEMLAPNGTAATPSISPVTGAYGSTQSVTITGSGTIKYLEDNESDPHIGTVYSGAFTSEVPPTEITVRAIQTNKKSSAITSVVYTDSTSTFNTTDISGGGFTASNFNRTIEPTVSGWRTARVSSYKSSGKLYIEFECVTGSGNAFYMFGFASSGFTASDYLGTSNYSAGLSDGTPYNSGFDTATSTGVTGNPTVGMIYALAIDFTAGKAFIAKNNTWLNSSDPAAGTNPSFTFTPGTVGSLAAAISLYVGGGIWKVSPTAALQTYSAPSGYSEWG